MSYKQEWRIDRAGRLDRLYLAQEVDNAQVNQNEVKIRTRAVGLNFADLFAIAGLYSATPEGAFTPGLEFCGEVVEVGENVTQFRAADKVMGALRFGAFSSRLVVHEQQCVKLPEGWSFSEGAAFLVQTFTAWYALNHQGALQSQQHVLVLSAAGGVGLQAMRIAKAIGANPIGCVGHAHKKTWLKEHGFDDVFIRTASFAQDLSSQLHGRPLHLVLEAIGGKVQKACFEALAPQGRLVTFGAAQYTPGKNRPRWIKAIGYYLNRPKYDALAMISENKSIMAFNLIWLWQNTTLFGDMFEQIRILGLPAPYVGHQFQFDQLPLALECLRSGQSIGKVVVLL